MAQVYDLAKRELLQSTFTRLYHPDGNFRLLVHGNLSLASLRANRTTLLLPHLNLDSLSLDWTHLIGRLPFSRAERRSARRDAYSVPCAFLVPEAQMTLLDTLSNIALTIILDEPNDQGSSAGKLERDSEGCNEWYETIPDGLKIRGNELWLPAANLHSCQPWSKPPAFDIDGIIAIARGQVDETQDQLWLSQTEPTVFFEQAVLLEKIWLHTLLGVENWSDKRKYQEIARALIYQQHANAREWEWKWTLEEYENVKYERGKSWDPIRVKKPLFWKYENTLGSLMLLLLHCLNSGSHLDLQQDVASAPSFKDYWEVTEITEGLVHTVSVRLKKKYKLEELYEKDRLMWYSYVLALDPVEQSSWDVPLVLQRLDEHLNHCPPTEAARVSSIMYGYVAYSRPMIRISKPSLGEYS